MVETNEDAGVRLNRPNAEALKSLLGVDGLPTELLDFPSALRLPLPIYRTAQNLVKRTGDDFRERATWFYYSGEWRHGITMRGSPAKFDAKAHKIDATSAPRSRIPFHLLRGWMSIEEYRHRGLVLDVHTHPDLSDEVLTQLLEGEKLRGSTIRDYEEYWRSIAAPTPSADDVAMNLSTANSLYQKHSSLVCSLRGMTLIVPNPSIEASLPPAEFEQLDLMLDFYEALRSDPNRSSDIRPTRLTVLRVLNEIIGDRGAVYFSPDPNSPILTRI